MLKDSNSIDLLIIQNGSMISEKNDNNNKKQTSVKNIC